MNAIEAVAGLPRQELALEEKSQAQRLVELVPATALFCSTDNETAYATVPVERHVETWPVQSTGFRRWLGEQFYMMDGKPPKAQARKDALDALEARAQYCGRVQDVHVRLAGLGDRMIYLDLVNP